MKQISILLFVLMLISVASLFGQQSTSLASAKSYANSQSDTATFPSATGNFGMYDLTYTVRDTAAADVTVQTKPKGQATASWTTTYSDSVIYANTGTNYVKNIPIRGTTVDRAPGINVDIRVITAWRASGNGVTSPTYDNVLKWSK